MKREVIYKRPDGLKVKVTANLWVDYRGHNYSCHVEVCPKGKRKYRSPSDDEIATNSELMNAEIALWEELNPVKMKINQ